MQVRHGFACVRPVVHHEPETVGEVKFLRDRARDKEQVPEHGLIGGGRLADAWDEFFFGTMRRCTGACGWMSWSTTQCSSSCSIFAGISRSVMRWKIVLGMAGFFFDHGLHRLARMTEDLYPFHP